MAGNTRWQFDGMLPLETIVLSVAMSNPDDDSESLERPDFSRKLYLEWRSPRYGRSNPERLTNPVWQWLAGNAISAYAANDLFDGPGPFDAGPGWCCDRFGQTVTGLPDGRRVRIGGEHEDHYDPDFFIYNDVIVDSATGDIEVFGYPTDDFPPTDNHSATLIGESIVLIGALGYPQERQTGQTQVLRLDTSSWRIEKIESKGEMPGWISGHSTSLDQDGESITVSGGEVCTDDADWPVCENFDDWQLSLKDWTWSRLTRRAWQQRNFVCCGENPVSFAMMRVNAMMDGMPDMFSSVLEELGDLADEIDGEMKAMMSPKFDREVLDVLYRPPIEHEFIESDPEDEDEDSFGSFQIRVDGVLVCYVEEMESITMTVEGDLPAPVIDLLAKDLQEKLKRLTGSAYKILRR